MSQMSTGLSRHEKRAAGKPWTVTVEEASRRTGLGITTIYYLLKTGKIRSTRVGRRRLLFWDSVEQLLEAGANCPPQPLPGVPSRWRRRDPVDP